MDTPADHTIELRMALGSFATGVTIVTTLDSAGLPVGITANSFNSVSLDPPLVLWSLAKNARSFPVFSESGHFAVHLMAADQVKLAQRFAISAQDKFAGIDWQKGELDSPIFTDHAGVFECRTRHQYDGGDHVIFVGEIVAFDANDYEPLVYHAGTYTSLADSD